MNYKIIMLPQPILVGDSDTDINDFGYRDGQLKHLIKGFQFDLGKPYLKVLAGLPDLPKLDLSLIGWVDVENKVKELMGLPNYLPIESMSPTMQSSFEFGVECFKAAQNEKKYTLSELELAIDMAREGIRVTRISEWETEKEFEYSSEQIIRHLSKPKEYLVEVEMELISNEYDYDEDETTLAHSIESWEQPKITNNTIKILRTI